MTDGRKGAMQPANSWWGEFDFEPGTMRRWRLGPFSLWVSRHAGELRVATRAETGDDDVCPPGEACSEPLPEDVESVRFSVRDSVRTMEIGPAAADRSAIVKSDSSYIVPPGGAVTSFISSPVWLQIRFTAPVRLIHEVPTQRPSDTWFGPSTLEGELCYAVRTSVRYNLANLPVRPNRAVSVVRIVNNATTPLPLARLRLPLPNLGLYADPQGRLWTEAVTLERQEDGDLAAIKLGKSAAREAGECVRIRGPREKMVRQPLIRSFTGLLGLAGGKGGHERVVE